MLDARVLLPCDSYDVGPGAPDIEALLGEPAAEDSLESLNQRRASLGLSHLTFVALTPCSRLSSEVSGPAA